MKDISSLLGIKYLTVWAIVKQFNTTGSVIPKKKGGDKRSKLTSLQKNTLLSWVDQNCILKLSDIVARIRTEFNISVNTSTVERVIKDFHCTIKSVVTVPEKRNDDKTIRLRSECANGFRSLETEFENSNFIFIDEVGFSVVTRPKRGHLKTGCSPYVSVSAARSRNISVLAVMNKYGMIHHKVFNQALNGEDFKSALIEIKDKCTSKGILNPIFLAVNARIHHYSNVEELIASLQLKVVYLPPYSPFLNPIENIFSVWKNLVIRGEAKSENELKKLIVSKFGEITLKHCDSFYKKMLGYICMSERREIIEE